MQVRRLLALFALSVLLAGIVIWICLQRESMALKGSATSTESPHLAAIPSTSHDEGAAERDSSHVNRHRAARMQVDQVLAKRFLTEARRLVTNGQLNQDAVRIAMQSPQFNDFVRKMRDEMAADAAARDVGELYIGAIRNNLRQTPKLRINEFACGITICAGSIEAPSQTSGWDEWWKRFDDDANAPTYVFTELPFDRGVGVIEHRFVFSTDPDSNALTASF